MSYGEHVVIMPYDRDMFDLYCNNVGYSCRTDIDDAWIRHNDLSFSNRLYLSVKYFDPKDITDDGKLRIGPSRSTADFTIVGSKRKLVGVMVPAATVQIISGDHRYLNSSCSSSRRIKNRTTESSHQENPDQFDRLVSSRPSPAPAGALLLAAPPAAATPRKQSTYETHGKPRHHAVVADPYNLVYAMFEINEHARVCGTDLSHKSRDDVHYHGLCGSIYMRCIKGEGCCNWPEGMFCM